MTPPRIALLGFSIECNRFAPVATETDFRTRTLIGGADLIAEARSPAPRMLGEMPGFIAAMDAAGPGKPVPSLLAMAEPNGPVDQAFFDRLMQRWENDLTDGRTARRRLSRAARRRPDDTEDHDPEGTLLGPGPPHRRRRTCRSSPPSTCTPTCRTPMSTLVNGFIGYRTNPHLDMRERGAEAAAPAAPAARRHAQPSWPASVCQSCRRPSRN